MVDISKVGIVSVPKSSALEISRRELSEDVWFGIGTGTLLVVEQSTLGNRPRCVMYTTVMVYDRCLTKHILARYAPHWYRSKAKFGRLARANPSTLARL